MWITISASGNKPAQDTVNQLWWVSSWSNCLVHLVQGLREPKNIHKYHGIQNILKWSSSVILMWMMQAVKLGICMAISIHMFPNWSIWPLTLWKNMEDCPACPEWNHQGANRGPRQPFARTHLKQVLKVNLAISSRPKKQQSRLMVGKSLGCWWLNDGFRNLACVFWKNYGWQVLCTLINIEDTRNLLPWIARCPSLTFIRKVEDCLPPPAVAGPLAHQFNPSCQH